MKKRVKISENTKKKMVGEFLDGATIKAIAEKYDSSSFTVGEILKKNGINPRAYKLSLHDKRDAEILKAHLEGVSTREISEVYGMGINAINSIIRSQKALRFVEFPADEEEEEILTYAREDRPKLKKVVVNGTRYVDVSPLWGI